MISANNNDNLLPSHATRQSHVRGKISFSIAGFIGGTIIGFLAGNIIGAIIGGVSGALSFGLLGHCAIDKPLDERQTITDSENPPVTPQEPKPQPSKKRGRVSPTKIVIPNPITNPNHKNNNSNKSQPFIHVTYHFPTEEIKPSTPSKGGIFQHEKPSPQISIEQLRKNLEQECLELSEKIINLLRKESFYHSLPDQCVDPERFLSHYSTYQDRSIISYINQRHSHQCKNLSEITEKFNLLREKIHTKPYQEKIFRENLIADENFKKINEENDKREERFNRLLLGLEDPPKRHKLS